MGLGGKELLQCCLASVSREPEHQQQPRSSGGAPSPHQEIGACLRGSRFLVTLASAGKGVAALGWEAGI